jgi:hypothetical protein
MFEKIFSSWHMRIIFILLCAIWLWLMIETIRWGRRDAQKARAEKEARGAIAK